MIKFKNSISTIVALILLSAVLSSCIGEEMMTCGEQILVQRIGEGGNTGTRGVAISSNADLKGGNVWFLRFSDP